MSRGKKLLILIAVLAVAVAAVVLVIHFAGNSDSGNDSAELSVVDTDDIESVKWTYEGNTYRLVPDEEDSLWMVAGMEELDLDPSTVTNMVSVVSNLYAQKEVAKEISDDAAYGFDDPEIIVTVKTGESETTFTLGNFNETAGYYYLKSSESQSLWYVDSQLHSAFAADALDLVKRESLPTIETGDVAVINISYKGTNYQLENNSSDADDAENTAHFTIEGSDIVIDNSIVSNMISTFDNISWTSVSAIDASNADLNKYGLDEPQLTFSMTYSYESEDTEAETDDDGNYPTKTLVETSELLIGNIADADNEDESIEYYAMLKNGKNIYTIAEATADTFLIDYPTDLYNKTVIEFDASDITALSVTYKNTVYDITVNSEESIDEYGSETTATIYKLDGKTIDLDEFISFITSLKAKSISDNIIKNIGDTVIAVSLTGADGDSDGIVLYEMPDDTSACAVQVNGITRMTADYIDCDNIADAFRDALAGIEN